MDAKKRLPVDQTVSHCDYRHAVHKLRLAAAGGRQSEEHRRWIRAATRC